MMSIEALEFAVAAKLDPREEHLRIAGPDDGALLFLRCLPAAADVSPRDRVVLYVHGGTFPSGLRFFRTRHPVERISIIAHSWGSIVSGR